MCNPADSKHHIKPQSRGGTHDEENIVYIPESFHTALHIVFHNLTIGECMEFLKFIADNGGDELDGRDLYDARLAVREGKCPWQATEED